MRQCGLGVMSDDKLTSTGSIVLAHASRGVVRVCGPKVRCVLWGGASGTRVVDLSGLGGGARGTSFRLVGRGSVCVPEVNLTSPTETVYVKII